MDLQHIKYFIAVVDYGSINAASTEIRVAPPTISQALRSLERDLRTKLFYRIHRGMVPTSAGYALISPARRILRAMSTAAGTVPSEDGQLRGRVDLRAHPSVISGMIPNLISAFHRRHPHVQIAIDQMYQESHAAGLIRDAVCELVVTHLPLAGGEESGKGDVDGLMSLELGTQIYDLALPPKEDSLRIGTLGWDEIDEKMIVVQRGMMHVQRMFEAMSPRQQTRQPAVVLQNREARLMFVLNGVAATWIERSMQEWALERGARIRIMEPAMPVSFGLVYQKDQLSPVAQAFVDLAMEMTGVGTGALSDCDTGVNVEMNARAAEES